MVAYRGGGFAGKGQSIDYTNGGSTVGNGFLQGARTMDFQDKNGNGTDDRDEGVNSVDTDKDGTNDNAPQQSEAGQDFDRINQGIGNFRNTFSDTFFQPVDKDNDRINDLQTGLYADQVGKNFDMARSEQQADFQSGLYKDNALFGANLELRNNRELTADQFAYTQRDKDKTFELTNQFEDNNLGRDIVSMGAAGQQNRMNIYAQGNANDKSAIVQGEQNRLQSAADGDQARRGYRVLGDETRQTDTNRIDTEGVNNRKGYRVQGDETRQTDTNRIDTEGVNDRKGYRVLGDETRQTDTNRIDTQGVNDRKGYRVQGTENRLTDTNRINTEGTQNRLTDTNRINTEGTQNRLTDTNRITSQGSEDRKNYEFEDNINARGEARSSARARGLARGF